MAQPDDSMPRCEWIFAQIHEMSQSYFFELLPGNFTDLYETWHDASVDPPDKKLLNNNFLQILFQTGSVAYLHIGVPESHETQVTTSP